MKLCRFELKSAPGEARSGMVYSGKIYETDNANPVAVHEAEAIRPLSPIPHAPSLRIFQSEYQAASSDRPFSEPNFFYGNPASLVGASQLINYPESTIYLGFEAFVAAVLIGDAFRVEVCDADNLVLGLTLLNLLVARDRERVERRAGAIGASYDLGGAIGPVITTPDELEDSVADVEFGKRYSLSSVVRVNGVERSRGMLSDLPMTFAQAISSASQTCTLKAGDIIAIGPATESPPEAITIDPGDEVQLSVENLGTISLKLTQ